MKKLFTFTLSFILVFTFTITAFADVPSKKTQIDWLISGASGDLAALGGDPANGTGEFKYDFSSEDGSLKGIAGGNNGQIWIYALDDNGDHIEDDGHPAVEFARNFTQHFATLAYEGHFHASHRLSAKSTEEFPVELGSTRIMTFCYDADADGGLMNAIEFEGVVKLVSNLSNGGHGHGHGHDDDCDDDHDHDDDDCDDDHHDHTHGSDDNAKTGISGAAGLLVSAVLASAGVLASRKRKN
ncbi:MAG: hypothetical protein LBC82_07750 [Oscillospiraceae bacterium]|jgi:hypothetical protein|nr:hypothetical protein [Oscillospiraceae bacterium]